MRKNIFLILVFLLFLVSRLYKVSEIPASLYWDEASIGYNAYSVLKTGRDEWGEFLPLHFRAFGEFKLPVYIYSVLVTEAFFGLTQFSVRFPAVIYSTFAVLALYLLLLKLIRRKTPALLGAFLFSVSPWFFIFSRTGYEATAGLAFFLLALFFLLGSLKKRRRLLVAVFCFILASYSYNSFRILTPFFLGPALIYFAVKNKRKAIWPILISGVLLALSIWPIYRLYRLDVGLARYQTVAAKQSILTNYFSHFAPRFLFSQGDPNPRSQLPGAGELYLIDLPFLVLGTIYIFKKRGRYLAILFTLLIAFIPAAITKESPHALRSILAAPALATVSAIGVFWVADWVGKYKRYVLTAVVAGYLVFFSLYFNKFISSYNRLTAQDWQSPYKEIFSRQKSGEVTDKYGQPYIFALFYNEVDPREFWATKKLNPVSDWGFSTIASFDDFQFVKHD